MNFDVIVQNFHFLMQGLFITLKVAFLSMIFSLLLGTILGIIRYSKFPLISVLVGLFIDITRSIPLILYIIFIHFSISPYLYAHANFLRYIGIDSLQMYSAILAIVIFTSAYIAEIVRSGIESVEKEQILAAKALALNSHQIMEFIILPQALSRMKPALCAQLITLVKDTSLASAIGLIELTRASEIIYENSINQFQVLLFAAFLYILINCLIQKLFYSDKITRKVKAIQKTFLC